MNQRGIVVYLNIPLQAGALVILKSSELIILHFQFIGVLHAQMSKVFAHAVYNLLLVQLWQAEKEDGPNLPCDTCNGKGWTVCDFCKGQKTNVQVRANKFYRRCPSCRAVSFSERTLCFLPFS